MPTRQLTVQGRVIDAERGEPISEVPVHLLAHTENGQTRLLGRSKTLPTGHFTVRAAARSSDLQAVRYEVVALDADERPMHGPQTRRAWRAGTSPVSIVLRGIAPAAQRHSCDNAPVLRGDYSRVAAPVGASNTLRMDSGTYAGPVLRVVGTVVGSDGRGLGNLRVRVTGRSPGRIHPRPAVPAGHPLEGEYEDPSRTFELGRAWTDASPSDTAGTFDLDLPTALGPGPLQWRGQGWPDGSAGVGGWDDVESESPVTLVIHVEAPAPSGEIDMTTVPSLSSPYVEVARRVLVLESLQETTRIEDFLVASLGQAEDTVFHRLKQKFSSFNERFYTPARELGQGFGINDILTLAQVREEPVELVTDYFAAYKLADDLAVSANRARMVFGTSESLTATQDVLSHERIFGLLRQGMPKGLRQLNAEPLSACRRAIEQAGLSGEIRPLDGSDLDSLLRGLLDAGVGYHYTHGTGTPTGSPSWRQNTVGAVLAAGMAAAPPFSSLPGSMSLDSEGYALVIHRALRLYESLRRGELVERPAASLPLWSADPGAAPWDASNPTLNTLWNMVRHGMDWDGTDLDGLGTFGDEVPAFTWLEENTRLGHYSYGVSVVVDAMRIAGLGPATVSTRDPLSDIAPLTPGATLPPTLEDPDEYAVAVVERARTAERDHVLTAALVDPAIEADPDVRDFVGSLPDASLLQTALSWDDVASWDDGTGTTTDVERKALLRKVRERQRLARLGARGSEATTQQALQAAGVSSARDIATRGKKRTLDGTGVDAEAVHARAVHQTMAGAVVHLEKHPNSNDVGADASSALAFEDSDTSPPVHDEGFDGDASSSALRGYVKYPEWRTIFSPLAYLTDLLQWVDARGGWDGAGGLAARRPDLALIHLSDANTYQEIPTLDLALEVLEARTATSFDGAFDAYGSGLLRAVPTAGDGPSAVLIEHAYHHDTADALDTVTWPVQTPFSLPVARLHAFLPLAGLSRADAMEAWTNPTDLEIHGAVLGLAPAFVRRLDSTTTDTAWSGDADPAVVAAVPRFMDHFSLSLDEVKALVAMRVLHRTPADQRPVEQGSGTWSFDNLVFGGPAWTTADLQTVSRILRLRAATGWSLQTLDRVLRGLTAVDAQAVERIAGVLRVQEHTGLDADLLASWWADLDVITNGDPSPYASVYLERSSARDHRASTFSETSTHPLQVNADETDVIGSGTATFDEVTAEVRGALGLDADAFLSAVSWLNDTLGAPESDPTALAIDLAHLSALHRLTSLATWLEVPVQVAIRLTRSWRPDGDVFASPTETVAFLDAVRQARSAGLTPGALLWIAESPDWNRAETDPAVPSQDIVARALGRIREQLRAVARDLLATSLAEGPDVDASWADAVRTLASDVLDDTVIDAAIDATTTGSGLGAAMADVDAGLEFFDGTAIASEMGTEGTAEGRGVLLRDHLLAALARARGLQLIHETLQQAWPDLGCSRALSYAAPDGLRLDQVLLDADFIGTVSLDDAPDPTPWTSIDEAAHADAFAGWRYAARLALLAAATGWTTEQVDALLDASVPGFLNPNALPTSSEGALPELAATLAWSHLDTVLDEVASVAEPDLLALWSTVDSAASDADTRDALAAGLATRLNRVTADMDALLTAKGLGAATRIDLTSAPVFLDVVRAATLLQALGLDASTAASVAATDPGFADADAAIEAVRSTVPDADAWARLAGPVWQSLKARRRDALVGWMRHQSSPPLTADALYEELLVDVSMEACGRTSRVKQAISATQQFVQRWLLGLESAPALGEDDRDDWKWMKTYRVWEAARRVFLYPENWLEPELRKDKSSLFEDLERQLSGDALTPENAERAYESYVQGLHELGHLEVISIYDEVLAEQPTTETDLHVVGRTRSEPARYFIRSRHLGRWMPWEPLDVGIEGEHVYLVRHLGRLIVIWAAFEERKSSDNRKVFARLRWSVRQAAGWSEPRTCPTRWLLDQHRSLDVENPGVVQFRTQQFTDEDGHEQLAIWLLRATTRTERVFASEQDKEIYDRMMNNPNVKKGENGKNVEEFLNEHIESEIVTRVMQTPETCAVWDPISDGIVIDETHRIAVAARSALPSLEDVTLTLAPADARANHFRSPKMATGPRLPGGSLDMSGRRGLTLFVEPGSALHPHQVWNATFDRPFVREQQGTQVLVDVQPGRVPLASFDGVGAHPADPQPSAPHVGYGKGDVKALAGPATSGTDSAASLQPEAIDLAVDSGFQVVLEDVGELSAGVPGGGGVTYDARWFDHLGTGWLLTSIRRHGVEATLRGSPQFALTTPLFRQQLAESDLYPSSSGTLFGRLFRPFEDRFASTPSEVFALNASEPQAAYNWELFFHIPMLIAARFNADGQFDEARRWLEMVFDPTSAGGDRTWRFRPFAEGAGASQASLVARATGAAGASEEERALSAALAWWSRDPFDAHRAASVRQNAYRRWAVKSTLENLIAWGDERFARYSMESINEARQLYVLAASLLGPRPVGIDAASAPDDASVGDLLDAGSELALSDAYGAAESYARSEPPLLAPSAGLPSAMPGGSDFFGIPANEHLLALWDLVADRLFKIRHCLNLDGEAQPLPLFEPPIDPGLLVRATARGADLTSALRVLGTPLPFHRFQPTVQRAMTLAASVRGLGQSLLSAMEKRDGEAMARLRAEQEADILERMTDIRETQVREAELALDGLKAGRAITVQRLDYYTQLLDEGLSAGELTELTVVNAYPVARAVVGALGALKESAKAAPEGSAGTSGNGAHVVATTGGTQAAAAPSAAQQQASQRLDVLSASGSLAGRLASYARRTEEWEQLRDLARLELEQIDTQLDAARVRIAVARKELDQQRLQRENSRKVLAFMTTKYTSKELYDWMVGELKALHYQTWRMATDMALRAQICFQRERARPDARYIRVDSWDGARSGLLAGEKLAHDLERMDTAYALSDVREYELTKNVSLARVDGTALARLREQGFCFFHLPEVLFDLDAPGHYLRRMRQVTVSVPCVAGPVDRVYAKLSLVSSKTRYLADRSTDATTDSSAMESIVTSVGQGDTGTFGGQDTRYQPFELRGAVDTVWKLELLDRELPRFDHDSITDVVLQLAYTARDGGDAVADAVRSGLVSDLNALTAGFALDTAFDGGPDPSTGSTLAAVSARRDAPDAWFRLLNPPDEATSQTLELDLDAIPLPHAHRERALTLDAIQVVFLLDDASPTSPTAATLSVDIGATSSTLTLDVGTAVLDQPAGELTGLSEPLGGTLGLALDSAAIGTFPAALVENVSDTGTNHRFKPGALRDVLIFLSYTLS